MKRNKWKGVKWIDTRFAKQYVNNPNRVFIGPTRTGKAFQAVNKEYSVVAR